MKAVTVLLLVLAGWETWAAEVPPSLQLGLAPLPDSFGRVLPALDHEALIQRHDIEKGSGPWVFAEPLRVDWDVVQQAFVTNLPSGSLLYRFVFESSGAENLNVALSEVNLPAGTQLWLYNRAEVLFHGPYTSADVSDSGQFWTPMVNGSRMTLEIRVPNGVEGLHLRLRQINHGFRALDGRRHGNCNNDVVCPEGTLWQDQIRSVGYYTINGFGICSGQLVNNTAQDGTPYFLSAEHCGINSNNAASLVFYFNVEAPQCGLQGQGNLSDTLLGADVVASHFPSDHLLLRIRQTPPAHYGVYYAGWDVSGQVPQAAVGIHHPRTHVKSISFDFDPLTSFGFGFGGETHWEVGQWEDGTTEPGSSGSAIFDPVSGLVVGVLTGGFASCQVIAADWYGKTSVAFEGDGTPGGQLRPWLDPLATGTPAMAGFDPNLQAIPVLQPWALVLLLLGLVTAAIWLGRKKGGCAPLDGASR